MVTRQETESAEVSLLDSGIVVFEPKPGARIGLEEVRENNRLISATAGEGPVLLLSRMKGIVKMSRDARVDAAAYADEHYRAVALVVGGPMSKILAAFFLGLNRPKTPTRAFHDEAEAIAWLESTRDASSDAG